MLVTYLCIFHTSAVMCQLSDDKYSVNEGETLSVTVECNKGGPESFTITIVSSHVSTDGECSVVHVWVH